jgi:hypothetical protein
VKLFTVIAILLLAVVACAGGAPAPPQQNASADSLQKKIDWLAANGNQPHPDRRPTVIYDAEADAYMNSGRIKIPAGISQIHLTTTPGEAVATAKIDFDKLTAKERQQNPLWELFSGVHDVKVRCGVWGKDGMGNVHVQNVWFDGHEIPRTALEFFLEHYLKPKLPEASLANRFRMPAHIDSAIVGNGKTTLYQK